MSETISRRVVVWQEPYLPRGHDWCWMELPAGYRLPYAICLPTRAIAIQGAMDVCGKEVEILTETPE